MKVRFADVDLDKVYPEKEYVITEKKIREYLAAVFTRWEELTDEELLDGTIHAGQAFHYMKPLHWGDKVILSGRVVEKAEKRGLKFVVREVEARTEAGEPAITSRITIILPE